MAHNEMRVFWPNDALIKNSEIKYDLLGRGILAEF